MRFRLFVVILTISAFSSFFVVPADAAIKLGSKCTSKEFLKTVSISGKYFLCAEGSNGLQWFTTQAPTPWSASKQYSSILSKPAQNYVVQGQSLQSVEFSLGISLNTGTRPITLRELGDKIYIATCNLDGYYLTKNQTQIGLQPGNGMYNLLDGLMLNQASFDAIAYEITTQAAKH